MNKEKLKRALEREGETPLCDIKGDLHGAAIYFLTLSDSNSASNGVFVCSEHLLEVLNDMLTFTEASVDVQGVKTA